MILIKHVLSGHIKINKPRLWMINSSLMKVKSIAECSHPAIFWPASSDNLSLKPILVFFLSELLRQVLLYTVDSQIFAGVIFSRNFAHAKFREIKSSRNGEIIMLFTYIGKLCHSRDFFYVANMSFNAIRENKILAKISEFTVSWKVSHRGAMDMMEMFMYWLRNFHVQHSHLIPCVDPEGEQGVWIPLKNHKNMGFSSNAGKDPLKNHKAIKPAFNVGPSVPPVKLHLNGVSLADPAYHLIN